MKRFMNKKVATIGLAAGLALGAAGAAFAYFSTTGSGTGSASTGSATALTITQTDAAGDPSGLVPGGPAGTIHLSIHNGSSTAQAVGSVSVAVTAVTSGTLSGTDSQGNSILPCDKAWYTTTSSANVGVIPAGGTATTTATVSLTETNGNEDNCQAANGGGALSLSFSA